MLRDFLAVVLGGVTKSAEGPEQTAQRQVKAEDSPRHHVSSFWSNLPAEEGVAVG